MNILLRRTVYFLTLSFLIIPRFSYSQKSKYFENKLDSIRNEITNYENLIRAEEKHKENVLSKLEQINKNLYLRRNLIKELNNGIKETEQEIDKTESEIETIKEELKRGREILKGRIIHLYKYNRFNELEAILLSKSINQFFTGVKYFKLIADIDKKRFEEYIKKINLLDKKNKKLEKSLQEKRWLRNEKQKEESELENNKKVREKELQKVNRNKEMFTQAKLRLVEEEKEIADIVARLYAAERRISPALEEFKGIFAKKKGKLDWPVEGRITTKYGMEVDPKYKTRTFNRWIDIKASYGSPVKVVSGGEVALLKWMPSFGTTVFINHLDGYYTAYAHLSEVNVELGQVVRPGDIIGFVGDDSSLDGAKLTFFLYKNGKDLNPEVWLRK